MASPRVYFTVFAGRRRYLSVLLAYVRPLLDDKTLDVAHLWDYCRLQLDREYLKTVADPSRGIEIVNPPASDKTARYPNKWKGYYVHYAALLKETDYLVKCDDDVVFIANLPVLLNVAKSDTAGAHLMYYPSVVNNDVSASYQAADGVLTDPEYVLRMRPSIHDSRYTYSAISDWYNCTKCASHVHTRFLSNPESFFTGCIHEWSDAARVPINFFVMRGGAVRQHFGSYVHEQFVDEPYFTALLTARTKLPSLLVTDTVVSHFSFGFQHMQDEKELLEKYRKLGKDKALLSTLKEKYGGRTLSTVCPSTAPSHLLQGRRNNPRNDEPPWSEKSAGGKGGGGGGGKAKGMGSKGRGAKGRGSKGGGRGEPRL